MSASAFMEALAKQQERNIAKGWFVKAWTFGPRLTVVLDTRQPPKNMHPLDSRRKLGALFDAEPDKIEP